MLKKSTLYLFILVLGLSGCSRPDSVEINNHAWNVAVATTPQEQEQGLSGKPRLASSTGMLFIFQKPVEKTFWMKNMNFPLDMIWIKAGKIVRIDANLPPEGERPTMIYPSYQPIDMVLEINAGEAKQYDLKIGDKIKYDR